MKKRSTSQHLAAESISPNTAGASMLSMLVQAQKQPPRKWDLEAVPMLGCGSAGIKYLNSFLTECMKHFYISKFHREGLYEVFFKLSAHL